MAFYFGKIYFGAFCLLILSISGHAFSPVATIRTDRHCMQIYATSSDKSVEELQSLGFTRGLCEALIRDSEQTSRRFWIMDDSGSMAGADGNRLIVPKANDDHGIKMVQCTRWKELQDTAIYHAKLVGYLHAPTEFQFLNKPGKLLVKNQYDALNAQQKIQQTEPIGVTPLAECIKDVRKTVEGMLPKLMKDGTRVSLTIATDGLPTDSMGYGGEEENMELGKALGSLGNLPIWTVIRLCTDDEEVVSFYNTLDSSLELSMDVLDDFKGEANEVHSTNNWLSYGLPMHRFREGGFRSRLTDLLDERKLTKDELRDFCGLLFGEKFIMDGMPDPQMDWNGFRKAVDRFQKSESCVYDPVSSKMTPWMNLPHLGMLY